METIKIDQLATEIAARLQQYAAATDEVVQKAVDTVGEEGKATLRQTSPRRSGAYAKSWTFGKNQTKRNPHEYKRTIYAKAPHYRLTHLLEYGHDIRRNGTVVGWSPAKSHIAPVDQQVQQELEQRILAGIRKESE